jgi:hypothetical protein
MSNRRTAGFAIMAVLVVLWGSDVLLSGQYAARSWMRIPGCADRVYLDQDQHGVL